MDTGRYYPHAATHHFDTREHSGALAKLPVRDGDHREALRSLIILCNMQREIDEVEYVLTVLLHMRVEVSTNAQLYDPDARNRIDEAIARLEYVRREAQSMVCSGEQNLEAA